MGTWIEAASEGTTEGLTALRPDLAELLNELDGGATAAIGDHLKSLMAVRVAQMVGDQPFVDAADPALVDQATNWYKHAEVDEAERATLDLTESFVMDVHSITDEQVQHLRQLIGDQGVMDVMLNLAVLDGFTKFRRVFAEGSQ